MKARRTAVWALGVLALAGLAAYGLVGSIVFDPENSSWSWGPEGPSDEQVTQMTSQQVGQSFALPVAALLFAVSAFALFVIATRAIAVRWARDGRAVPDGMPRSEASAPLQASASFGDAHDERARVDAEVGRDH